MIIYRNIIDEATKRAEENQSCKRKAVGVVLYNLEDDGVVRFFHNGGEHCTNEVGNCGCSHAEPRAVMEAIRSGLSGYDLLSTYSPCTNCSNIIVDSRVIARVYYKVITEHDKRGLEILERGGVRTIQV